MSKRNMKLSALSLFLFSAVFILAGCGNKNQAQTQSQNQDQNKNQTQAMEQKRDGTGEPKSGTKGGSPPAGMTEACNRKADGDSCEVTMPSRDGATEEVKKVTGSCKKAGQSEVLSCMPTNMPQGGPRGGTTPAE